MRSLLLVLSLLVYVISHGQSISLTAGAGTGSYYIGERMDDVSDVNFSNQQSLFFELAYHVNTSPNGLKLRFQQTAVNLEGFEYPTGRALDGTVQTFTTALMYERLSNANKLNLGYQLGMGFTREELVVNNVISTVPEQDQFASIILGGIASVPINDQFRIHAELTGLWTDPLNTLQNSERWQTAGEDFSLLFQVGVAYKIF